MKPNLLNYDVERLENRQLLAGNVEIEVTSAGDLKITGDARSNTLAVQVIGNQVIAAPFPRSHTTVNGQQGTVTINHNGLRDLRVSLKGGSDWILVEAPQTTFRNGRLMGGGGNDTIRLGDDPNQNGGANATTFTGSVRVVLGAGIITGQAVEIGHVMVGGDLTIIGGATSDIVSIGGVMGGANAVAGRTTISLGGGSDRVSITDWSLNGTVNLNLGGGRDVVDIERLTTTTTFTARGGAGFDRYLSVAHVPAFAPLLTSFAEVDIT